MQYNAVQSSAVGYLRTSRAGEVSPRCREAAMSQDEPEGRAEDEEVRSVELQTAPADTRLLKASAEADSM